MKCKNMMYEQQINHLPTKTLAGLVKLVETNIKPKKYAAIVHDKDRNEDGKLIEDHIHLMMSFDNARSIDNIAKLLKDKPQYVEKWDKKANNGYAYLVHATDDARDKYQYDPSLVVANFDYAKELTKITKDVAKSRKSANLNVMLDEFYAGAVTRKQVEDSITGTQFGKVNKQLDAIEYKRMMEDADAWRKAKIEENATVKCIWIYGSEGTGKTSLAHKIADEKGDKVFFSGSSKDIFQGYKGEHTVVLEEMRPFNINYEDLLRITDPYGINNQVMLPARYKDKPFAADLIIITSPYSPYDYYMEEFHLKNSSIFIDGRRAEIDRFGQLRRRIDLTIMADMDYTYVAEFDDGSKIYKTVDGSEKINPYSAQNRIEKIIDPVEYYNSIFDEEPDEENTDDAESESEES